MSTDFTLDDCLFGAVKLTKMLILINKDIVAMALDVHSDFSIDVEFSLNLAVFGVDNSSSVHTGNKKYIYQSMEKIQYQD